MLRNADRHYRQSVYEKSLLYINKLLVLESTNSGFWHFKIELLSRLEQVEEGIRCCDEALITSNDKISLYVQKVKLLAKQRKDEALELCDDLIRLYPNDKRGYSLKITLLATSDRREEVLDVFTTFRQVFPKDLGILIDCIHRMMQLQRYEEAILCCDEVLLKDPMNLEAYQMKTAILSYCNRGKEALDFIVSAIGRFPTEKRFYYHKIRVLNALERHEEALACCEELIINNPKELQAYETKLTTLDKLGRLEEQLKCVNVVLEFDELIWLDKRPFTDIRDKIVEALRLRQKCIVLK